MTAIKNIRFASLAVIAGVSLIVLSFAPVAFASEWYEEGGGGWDSGTTDLGYWDSGTTDLSLSGYDVYDVYGVQDVYGTEMVYESGVGYSYNAPSYSKPSYTPSYSQPFSFRAPSTSYAPSYPAPQRPVQQQQQQQQQQQGGGQPINIVNTNNNNNDNNNVKTPQITPTHPPPLT